MVDDRWSWLLVGWIWFDWWMIGWWMDGLGNSGQKMNVADVIKWWQKCSYFKNWHWIIGHSRPWGFSALPGVEVGLTSTSLPETRSSIAPRHGICWHARVGLCQTCERQIYGPNSGNRSWRSTSLFWFWIDLAQGTIVDWIRWIGHVFIPPKSCAKCCKHWA